VTQPGFNGASALCVGGPLRCWSAMRLDELD